MAFEPIENYGVIGNTQSIALVGMNGSIDFLCYPDFDSPTVFAALLDDEKGGRFAIRPQLSMRVRQLYLTVTRMQCGVRVLHSRAGLLGSFETAPQFSEKESLCNLE
jgi:GH15 family glucan-1,4-alpha-glucosidase